MSLGESIDRRSYIRKIQASMEMYGKSMQLIVRLPLAGAIKVAVKQSETQQGESSLSG